MDAVPVSVALAAGTLAAFNPCGFPVLVAFLAHGLGSGAAGPAPFSDRVGRGLVTGLLVATGLVGTFAVVALPVSLGLTAFSTAVPWIGLSFGVVLLVAGLALLAGKRVAPARALAVPIPGRRPATTAVLFGVGYGVASLGCTLPVFLSLVGLASTTGRFTSTLVVFGAYGVGLAMVLTALATAAALVGDGVRRWSGRLLPYVGRLTGVLLLIAGGYLSYYWARAGFGSPADAVSDPLIAAVTDFAAWIEAQARTEAQLAVVVVLSALVAAAALLVVRGSRRVVGGGLVLLILGGFVGFELGAGESRSSDPTNGADPGAASATDVSARAATAAERESLRNPGRALAISDLTDLAQLRGLFDDEASTPRVIALLSPTCVTCLRGADWLQHQLAEHPDADIAVFAVWLPLLPTDERTRWDDRILTDPRVIHLWDHEQLAGRWFAERGYGDLPVQWDALFVYGPESEWGDNEEPSDLLIWRRPIIASATELKPELNPLLNP